MRISAQSIQMDPILSLLVPAFTGAVNALISTVSTLVGKASQSVIDTVVMRQSDHAEILFRAIISIPGPLKDAAKQLEAEKAAGATQSKAPTN